MPSKKAIALLSSLISGAANSLIPVLVVDMFGTDLLACSLGLIYFIYGIGSMLGVPVVGRCQHRLHVVYGSSYVMFFPIVLLIALSLKSEIKIKVN